MEYFNDMLIERELELERSGVEIAVHQYRDKFQKDKAGGKDLTFYQPERKLVKSCVDPLAKKIEKFRSWPADVKDSIEDINQFDLAFIVASTCINTIYQIKPINRTYAELGEKVPAQIDYSRLKSLQPKYLETIVNTWKSGDYFSRKTSLSNALRKFDIKPTKWNKRTCLKVGRVLTDLFIDSTGLFEIDRYGQHFVFRPIDDVMDWLEKAHIKYESFKPKFMPMIVKPESWRGVYNGGYYSNTTAMKLKIMKNRSVDGIKALCESNNIQWISATLNAVQETPWRINRKLLDVMKKCDGTNRGKLPFSKNHDIWTHQKSKRIALKQILWMAENFQDEPEIYFVWTMDWRGRIYPAVPYINPQADDSGKSLLEFERGKPLGDKGWYWLAVHGANCFGKDKLSLEERIQFVHENESHIVDSAKNPLAGDCFWEKADKPFSFLAFCFEWEEYLKEGNSFVSHLPIAQDASANGLQHFAALTRDEVVGKLVNLGPGQTPNERPADIYTDVANVVSKIVEKDAEKGNKIAQLWVGKVDRKLVKRPVMTFAYSATQYTYKEQILEELYRRAEEGITDIGISDFGQVSIYLASKINEGIGSLLKKPVETMKWLQDVTRIIVKQGSPVTWTAPSGLKVHQEYRKANIKKIDTYWGNINIKINTDGGNSQLDSRAMANGIAPNFIHSLDASHLISTVFKCIGNGIYDFSLIHDSYGCHACDIELLRKLFAETLIEMYSEDLLENFRKEVLMNLAFYLKNVQEN